MDAEASYTHSGYASIELLALLSILAIFAATAALQVRLYTAATQQKIDLATVRSTLRAAQRAAMFNQNRCQLEFSSTTIEPLHCGALLETSTLRFSKIIRARFGLQGTASKVFSAYPSLSTSPGSIGLAHPTQGTCVLTISLRGAIRELC